MLTLIRLKEVLRYDRDTGLFFWLVALSRRVQLGVKAGSVNGDGYVCIQIDGKMYQAHRLAWFYEFGVWPMPTCDHRDTVRTHNWITNLREATLSQNRVHRSTPSKSNTGVVGVSWSESRQRFVARTCVGGKQRLLCSSKSLVEAQAAYDAFAKQAHGDFYP